MVFHCPGTGPQAHDSQHSRHVEAFQGGLPWCMNSLSCKCTAYLITQSDLSAIKRLQWLLFGAFSTCIGSHWVELGGCGIPEHLLCPLYLPRGCACSVFACVVGCGCFFSRDLLRYPFLSSPGPQLPGKAEGLFQDLQRGRSKRSRG